MELYKKASQSIADAKKAVIAARPVSTYAEHQARLAMLDAITALARIINVPEVEEADVAAS